MNKLNEKQKKILNIAVIALQIAAVLVAVIFSSIVLANPNVANAEIGEGRTKLLPVLTNSMAGDKDDSFKEGDLVIAKEPKNADELNVGDIITFKINIGGVDQLNTHRIVHKDVDGQGKVWFNTQVDNELSQDPGFVYAEDVLAVYSSHWKNVGSMIFWLQKPTNFFLVIVLPLILLFIYNIILFVRMLMLAKLKKEEEERGSIAVDEEAIKQKAIDEYLAKKEKEEKAAEQKAVEKEKKPAEDNKADTKIDKPKEEAATPKAKAPVKEEKPAPKKD